MSLSNSKNDQMYVVINKSVLGTSTIVGVCHSLTVAKQQQSLEQSREIVGPVDVIDTYTKPVPKIIKIDPGYDFINPDIFTAVNYEPTKQSKSEDISPTIFHKYE